MTASDAVSLVGVAGSGVTSVRVELLDGSSQTLTITDGTFGYAATTAATLPTSVSGYDAEGNLVDQHSLILAGGPGCTDSSCPGPTP